MKRKASKRKSAKKSDRETVSGGDFAAASNGLSGNRVFVSMSKTINIGNYESLRIEYGFGRTVDDGQMFDDVMAACQDDVTGNLQAMTDVVEKQIK